MPFTALVDEHNRPSMRDTLGTLLTRATTADIAIAHLRLAGLDLGAAEVGSIQRCRVMLGHLDAAVLLDGSPRDQLSVLASFALSGRLEMRTAPHHTWNPDFSVFDGLPDKTAAALLGAHYFGRPYPRFGLAFTAISTQPNAVWICRRRFEELWQAGYDVLPVVTETLSRLIEQP
jgi:hypothetical protein